MTLETVEASLRPDGAHPDAGESVSLSTAPDCLKTGFYTLADGLSEGVVVTDLESRILYANPHFCNMLGFDNTSLLGKRGYELFLPQEKWRLISERNRQRQSGIDEKYELQLQRGDGSHLWVEISATAFRGEEGQIRGTLSVFYDIDERKQRERELDTMVQSVTARYDHDFFEDLTRNLARTYDVSVAFVTECLDADMERVRTIAFIHDGRACENREFSLQHTACETVVGKQPVFYPANVSRLFPRDATLKEMAIEGYVGAPLSDNKGRPLGHIALMDTKPIPDHGGILAALQVIGSRAASEIQHNRIQARLREQNNRLKAEITARKQAASAADYLREEIRSTYKFDNLIGDSPAFRAVLERLDLVARTEATVLIQGETGTGKELVARAIHCRGSRTGKPLIKVNCAALPAELIESELFGHEKGAFTGAVNTRKGRFEQADGGTLFLDEIGELTCAAQAKLLRVIQEREFERVGGTRVHRTDVRLIAATNRDLQEMIRKGDFRDDLFYRLNVFPLELPPLRERLADLKPLAHHFLASFARNLGVHFEGIEPDSLARMEAYHWPGNIRELQNLIERAAILSRPPLLVVKGLTGTPVAGADLESALRNHLVKVLEQTGWVIEGPRGAARILGLQPSTLRSKLKKLALVKPG